MVVHLETTADIEVPPGRVWPLLSDLGTYHLWNPFMPEAHGSLAEGERLDIRLRPPEGSGMRIKPTVLAVGPNRELRWVGRLVLPGLFDGELRFTIERTTEGCRSGRRSGSPGCSCRSSPRGFAPATCPASSA